MTNSDSVLRTKIHLPSTRPSLVLRPRLYQPLSQGLQGLLTLIIAPAGFGKTTLVAACTASHRTPVAWLSLDKNDNQTGGFLNYLIAALREVDNTIGSKASQLLTASQEAPQIETILTCLVNDLDLVHQEIILVLDDYHLINNAAVHGAVAFLLEHCPNTFHMVITTRSDPPLPLARFRARGQMLELRAADLRFTELEAAQFLNDIMGLCLDAGSVAVLEERTEGWIAGLQMAALSMRDREDVSGFIKGFSGTNRYILDYLLEEILASQSPAIRRFLLYTSILERFTASLCDAILADDAESKIAVPDRSTQAETLFLGGSATILAYLERANLFLVPLDDERTWYRYHHLFADLLQAELQKTLGDRQLAHYHLRAAEWYECNGLTIESIHHASLASDFERIERLIEQNYIEMLNRGEMSGILRFWMGTLSREMVTRRPWLCLYEAFSRSWFGQLEEAQSLLDEAERLIRCEVAGPDTRSMLAYRAYVQSRVTAMQGDTFRAIELCLTARENIPVNNIGMQIETGITLGYEYFLYGDFGKANQTLREMIGLCQTVRAINNPVAACALLARVDMLQGRLHDAYDLFEKASQLIQEPDRQYLGAVGLIEVGKAAVLWEWNDLESALVHVKKGLDLLPMWGKADDSCLAYITLSRIELACGNHSAALEAGEKAAQLVRTSGVFSEAHNAVETNQVRLWLVQKDWLAVRRWLAKVEKRIALNEPFRYEDELTHISRARVFIAQKKPHEAIGLLSHLGESAQSGGRLGRLIEILILKALALQAVRDFTRAQIALTESLALAEPDGYVREYLDEGQPMRLLLTQWLAHADSSPLRSYVTHILSQFDAESQRKSVLQGKKSPPGDAAASAGLVLVEPLSQRELEVLRLIALGKTNQEIAQQLIVARGTIKAHAASIFRKLGATNRTDAVARARQLGILP